MIESKTGLIESPRMPHAETLAIVGWLVVLRGQIGVRHPFESSGSVSPGS
jgi:hypothetical protein